MTQTALVAKDSQKLLAIFRYPFDSLALTVTPLRKAAPKQASSGPRTVGHAFACPASTQKKVLTCPLKRNREPNQAQSPSRTPSVFNEMHWRNYAIIAQLRIQTHANEPSQAGIRPDKTR